MQSVSEKTQAIRRILVSVGARSGFDAGGPHVGWSHEDSRPAYFERLAHVWMLKISFIAHSMASEDKGGRWRCLSDAVFSLMVSAFVHNFV